MDSPADPHTMEEPKQADIVIILSSELIAGVIEAYFNQQLLKVPVSIVDLKPTPDGYAFSIAFLPVLALTVTDNMPIYHTNGHENGIVDDKVHQEAVTEALLGVQQSKKGTSKSHKKVKELQND